MLCYTEMFYIVAAILVGTMAVNTAIALVRKRMAAKSRMSPHAHWEQKLDEDDAQEIAARQSQYRRSKAGTTRGHLNSLTSRTHAVEEKKVDEDDMVEEVEQAFARLRQTYGESTYLGKHTAQGRENDTCLYARHRVNGLTQCDGEIASLQRNKHTILLKVNVHADDADLIQEKGWGVSSSVGALDKLAALGQATKSTPVTMPMPRTPEELRTVIIPVLEAAICCVAGVDPSA